MQRPAAVITHEIVGRLLRGEERGLALHRGVVRPGQIRRPAPQLRHRLRQRGQDLARGRPGRLLSHREDRQRRLELGGHRPGHQPVVQGGLIRVRRPPRLEPRLPRRLRRRRPLRRIRPGVRQHLRVDSETGLRVHPEHPLQAGDLLSAQLRAVHTVMPGLGRQRPADHRGQPDERGPVGHLLGGLDRVVQRLHVLLVAGATLGEVDVLHMPAIGGVPGRDVLGERDLGLPLDRNPIVVPNQHQVAQLLRPCQRRRLRGHTFLHTAVPGDAIDHPVEHTRLTPRRGRIQQRPLPAGRHREPNRVGHPRPQRTRGALDAGGVSELGMPRGQGALRPQTLQVFDLQPVAGQEQLGVLRQRAVTRRQHEPVPAHPPRVRRITGHHLLIQQVRHRSQRHRRPRMPVSCLLHRLGSQHPRCIHSTSVQVGPNKRCGHLRPLFDGRLLLTSGPRLRSGRPVPGPVAISCREGAVCDSDEEPGSPGHARAPAEHDGSSDPLPRG